MLLYLREIIKIFTEIYGPFMVIRVKKTLHPEATRVQQAFFCVFLRSLRAKKKTLGLAAQQEHSDLQTSVFSVQSVRPKKIRVRENEEVSIIQN